MRSINENIHATAKMKMKMQNTLCKHTKGTKRPRKEMGERESEE